MIVWLENPLEYTYLRKTRWTGNFKKLNPNKFIKCKQSAFCVVGYELLPQETKGYFEFWVYWLKDYDYDISPETSPYQDGGMPAEGVKPCDLVDVDFKFEEVRI